MRLHDSLIGTVLLLLALAVLWSLPGFPEPIGQPYGAALFPGLIAGGLAACAVALIVQGLRAQSPGKSIAWVEIGQGLRSPRHALGFLAVLASLAGYIVFAQALGFVVCGVLMLSVLMAAFGVRARLVVPIALIATLVIHTAFYKFLRVPLPWGILENWAW